MVHTGSILRQHARDLRHAPTLAERRVWAWLRKRTFGGYKFKRQFPIDRYVLDFYCPELKLAIELDGPQHDSVLVEYDGQRDRALASRGIEVVRITNELLARDSRLAAEMIRAAIQRRAKR